MDGSEPFHVGTKTCLTTSRCLLLLQLCRSFRDLVSYPPMYSSSLYQPIIVLYLRTIHHLFCVLLSIADIIQHRVIEAPKHCLARIEYGRPIFQKKLFLADLDTDHHTLYMYQCTVRCHLVGKSINNPPPYGHIPIRTIQSTRTLYMKQDGV